MGEKIFVAEGHAACLRIGGTIDDDMFCENVFIDFTIDVFNGVGKNTIAVVRVGGDTGGDGVLFYGVSCNHHLSDKFIVGGIKVGIRLGIIRIDNSDDGVVGDGG